MDWDEELHRAVRRKNEERVFEALENGADVNALDNEWWTPLMHTAFMGHTNIAKILISKGANVDVKDDMGETALSWACFNKHKDTAKLLIQNGADIIYALGQPGRGAKTINQIMEENPELSTAEEKYFISVFLQPEKMDISEKQNILKLLRRFIREGRIQTEKAKETFERMMSSWNQKIEFGLNGELRKPEKKPDGKNLKKLNRMI